VVVFVTELTLNELRIVPAALNETQATAEPGVPAAIAEVKTVPSGNLKPPEVDSTIPDTVKSDVGKVVPIPTLPVE